jgi:Rap1a immunity proteins
MLTVRLALLFSLLAAPMSARAQTALEAESQCRDFATIDIRADGKVGIPPTAQFCWGAFAATQQLIVLGDDRGLPLLKVCPPSAITRVQLIKVFLSFSQRHPELAHLSFGQVVWSALDESFPCGSK